jgi:hypothetical protein
MVRMVEVVVVPPMPHPGLWVAGQTWVMLAVLRLLLVPVMVVVVALTLRAVMLELMVVLVVLVKVQALTVRR